MPTLVFISDTHTKHYEIDEQLKEISNNHPDAILVHSGDISYRGRVWEVEEFIEWYSSLPFKNKIMIAGNHDFLFENDPEKAKQIIDTIDSSIIYLNDSGAEVDGLNFWGSPITPWFHNWAFNRVEDEIGYHWDLIPESTNILITHGPPYLTLDDTKSGLRVGCPELAKKISQLPDLKVHAFGHIHEAAGIVEKDGVIYVNASTLDLYYEVKNSPIILQL
ncbi:MAG: metallophosphatase domain-containing protein [Methanobacteriaceae archaeon]|nr:metallophosphatase domain-containing protein [Methanobacteriaceae archaeon]